VVTEPSFLALQGTKELLDTYDLVRVHYNEGLDLAGVIVNRWERTLEHRRSVADIKRYFGEGFAWQPYLPKRTALQEALVSAAEANSASRPISALRGSAITGRSASRTTASETPPSSTARSGP
jgi:cellulose biosynthesis protein BcsQ